MRSQSPEETERRVRCLAEGRVKIKPLPVVFAVEQAEPVVIEQRPLAGEGRDEQGWESQKS